MPNQNKNFLNGSSMIDEALNTIFRKDKNSILMGLGATDVKNIFGTTTTISKNFKKRVFDVPISENSLTGIIIGSSLRGLKPILTHQRVDFALLSLEQIINQAAKWRFMFGGQQNIQIVIRMIIGRGWGQGPQHSQSLQGIFAQIPGLKVVMPSTAKSLYKLLIDSFYDKNPVIFLEHRWSHYLIDKKIKNYVPKKLGNSNRLLSGDDLTIVSCSYMTVEVLKLSKYLSENNIKIDLIDLQTIYPIDKNKIINSVKKTKRAIILDTSNKTFGISAEISSLIYENCFHLLKKPVERLANPDYPVPTSYLLTKNYYPTKYEICKLIFKILDIKKEVSKKLLDQNKFGDQPDQSFIGPF